jgi:hypothetical protein
MTPGKSLEAELILGGNLASMFAFEWSMQAYGILLLLFPRIPPAVPSPHCLNAMHRCVKVVSHDGC